MKKFIFTYNYQGNEATSEIIAKDERSARIEFNTLFLPTAIFISVKEDESYLGKRIVKLSFESDDQKNDFMFWMAKNTDELFKNTGKGTLNLGVDPYTTEKDIDVLINRVIFGSGIRGDVQKTIEPGQLH